MQITRDSQHVHPMCDPVGPPESEPSLMESALWYAGLGWPVFPILAEGEVNPKTGEIATGKQPATRRGYKDATTDVDQITRWWSQAPNRNIGLPTGVRFDVIDIDVPDGLATLEQLRGVDRAVHGWVNTASGGVHLYIMPTGKPNKSRWLPGTDYRGVGGYAVAPPSKVGSGSWRWKHLPSPVVTGRGDTYGASCV
jgi:Bifunctional DNA primase/polymerase, N-terminal